MKEITLKDYREFCSSKDTCTDCPLHMDYNGGYENCLGFVTEDPESADAIIQDWKKKQEQEKIAKRQKVYVIYDTSCGNTVRGIATSSKKAKQIKEKIAQNCLADLLAVDTEDSGIYWDVWTDDIKEDFYEEQVKNTFIIKEMIVDTYEDDEGVHAI